MQQNDILASYKLERLLGRGMLGEVWVGEQMSLKSKRAVKIFSDCAVCVEGFGDRYFALAPKLAKLRHPHIVTLYEMDIDGYHYYMATDFVSSNQEEPQTLGDYLKSQGGKLPLAEARRLIGQICAALDYAAKQGVIHGNIKPSNVLIDADNNVQLVDIGLATIMGKGYFQGAMAEGLPGEKSAPILQAVIEADTRKRSKKSTAKPKEDDPAPVPSSPTVPAGVLAETCLCTPPEMRTAEGEWSARGDLYSVGALAYLLVTGRQTFDGDFVAPSELDSAIPKQWDTALAKALNVNPEARFENGKQFLEALDTPCPVPSQEPEGLSQRPDVSGGVPAPKNTMRKNEIVILVVCSVLFLALIVALCLLLLKGFDAYSGNKKGAVEEMEAAPTPTATMPVSQQTPRVPIKLPTSTDFASTSTPAPVSTPVLTPTPTPTPTPVAVQVTLPAPAGSGTQADPYQISTLQHLTWLDQSSEAGRTAGQFYKLMNDIDGAETKAWDAGAGFNPIGVSGASDPVKDADGDFRGSLDGNGKTISNLFIHRPGNTGIGLFANMRGKVTNLVLKNVSVSGMSNVGSVAGLNSGMITGCRIGGATVRGDHSIGGAVGNNRASISQSSYSGMVSGKSAVGGFLGVNENLGAGARLADGALAASVTGCSASAAILGTTDRIGGFVGDSTGGTINSCFASGNGVSGEKWVGGFIGVNRGDSSVLNCYAVCGVLGKSNSGGFAGLGDDVARLKQCFSVGTVRGSENVGGFIGRCLGNASLDSCLWDSQSSGLAVSAGGSGKTTVEMKNQATYSGWDFGTVWQSGDGYPTLRTVTRPEK